MSCAETSSIGNGSEPNFRIVTRSCASLSGEAAEPAGGDLDLAVGDRLVDVRGGDDDVVEGDRELLVDVRASCGS